MMLLLHAAGGITPHDLWNAWSFEPAVVASVAVTVVLYVRGTRKLSSLTRRSKARVRRESIFFFSGLAVLAAALISPLHRLGGALFSAHMIQHELLMALAAPLIVLGRPGVPLLWAFPSRSRRAIGNTLATSAMRSSWMIISSPFAAWLLHAVAIWGWHMPRFYDASVRSEVVHTAQHLSFLLTALLFWWSILGPRAQRRGGGAGIISLFTTGLHTTLLGALIATADHPLFAAYTAAGTQPWGLTPLSDQQLGGVIMWVPAGIVYLGAALFVFFRWIRESGVRVKRMEAGRRARDIAAYQYTLS